MRTGLTTDTFTAIQRVNKETPDLIKYLLSTEGVEYILTAKISNDVTEGRFGMYRNLAGSNYLVSVPEVI